MPIDPPKKTPDNTDGREEENKKPEAKNDGEPDHLDELEPTEYFDEDFDEALEDEEFDEDFGEERDKDPN